jgi:signal peptidase I
MNSISEKIANMNWQTVLIVMAVLLGIWYPLRKTENKHLKSVAEMANSLAVALGLVFLIIRPFIIQAFYIPSASMRPTLLEDDHIMVNKFIYRFKEPAFKDIIVFRAPPNASPEDNKEKDFIKRVIGVPGDVIRITAGYITVDNVPFHHEDLTESLRGFSKTGEGKVKLTNDGIFVDGTLVSNTDVARATMDMPNAQVRIFPGTVYKNGTPLDEPYTAEDCKDA